ncbi:hypothetical protein BDZ89DRAFT_1138711 [Hymenopellis radicata]|nr:hypothetical protein BDZ89DRAFT_1138711 [Hymenopellis radicata]
MTDRRYPTRSGNVPHPAKLDCIPPIPGRLWPRWKAIRGNWGDKPATQRQIKAARKKENTVYTQRVANLDQFFKENPDHVIQLENVDLQELDRRPKGDQTLLHEAEVKVERMIKRQQQGVRTSTLWKDRTGKPLDAEGLADFCETQQMVHDTGVELPQSTGDQRHRENIVEPFMKYEHVDAAGQRQVRQVVTGVKHHVECWTEQGNPQHGLMPSKDAIGKSANAHMSTIRYMSNIDRQSGLLNKLTQRFFSKVHAQEQRASAAGRWLKTRTANTLGLATLYNVQTATHLDRNDRWCKLTNWGKYRGGMFYLPDLDLVLEYNPGDVVIFASHCLYHAIGPWTPEEAHEGDVHLPGRVSWVHFNHQDVMELLDGKPADWMLQYGSNSTRM